MTVNRKGQEGEKRKGKMSHMGHYFFRLTGGEAHEFRFKAERNVPGGAVSVVVQAERLA